ncbi:MAG: hypothetical protein E7576_16005 [Ruminococcaceae bacterium]|jgi:hypothetical protein|nr:hypothetical protein [Oscillospiraceae bacterium]
MDFSSLPKTVFSGAYRAGHCQGIAVDLAKGFVYYSFTTMLVKTDLEGRFVGSVTGFCGHLGCIAFNPDDGRVYGSLEYKNDAIGRGIVNMLGGGIEIPDRFYMAIFDANRIDRADMPSSEAMRCAFLREVTDDYLADVKAEDGSALRHRYGCSGIDGTATGPDFGEADKEDAKRWLFVSYGVYGDVNRTDNDHQVILKYDIGELNRNSAPLSQTDMHAVGPEKPAGKYFVLTGNTTYGVQNLEYDPTTRSYLMCVYPRQKAEYPNPPMFAADARIAPKRGILKGVWPEEEGDLLTLDGHGKNGIPFPHGDTGIAALGDGFFYVSHHGKNDAGQYTNIRLYRLTDGVFEPVS